MNSLTQTELSKLTSSVTEVESGFISSLIQAKLVSVSYGKKSSLLDSSCQTSTCDSCKGFKKRVTETVQNKRKRNRGRLCENVCRSHKNNAGFLEGWPHDNKIA